MKAIENSTLASQHPSSVVKTCVRKGQSVDDYTKRAYRGILENDVHIVLTKSTKNSDLNIKPEITVKYVLLDKEERAQMTKRPMEFKILQWQRQLMKSISKDDVNTTYKDQINLSHPMQSLFWVVTHDYHQALNQRMDYNGRVEKHVADTQSNGTTILHERLTCTLIIPAFEHQGVEMQTNVV